MGQLGLGDLVKELENARDLRVVLKGHGVVTLSAGARVEAGQPQCRQVHRAQCSLSA